MHRLHAFFFLLPLFSELDQDDTKLTNPLLHVMFQNMTPSKRGTGRQPTESPSSMKKRKQLTMDDYVSTVCLFCLIANCDDI